MFGTNDFKAKISDLNEALKKPDLDFQEINIYLDDLNAFDCSAAGIFDEKNWIGQVVDCCTSIPANNSLLVAKSCNFLLNLLKKQRITFSNENLIVILKWINDAANESSDIAFLDILQVLNLIIKFHSSFFSEYGDSLVPVLFKKLELLTNVMQPNDVKLWRLLCLQSLAKNVLKEDRINIVNELFSILHSQSCENPLFHAKLWRIILETLDCMCTKGNIKWLLNKIPEVIGLVLASSVLGLSCNEPIQPVPLHPSTVCFQLPSDSKVGFINKMKPKSKVKRVMWSEKSDKNTELQTVGCSDLFQIGDFTSDSDISDSEGSQAARLVKEQAKTRLLTFNFIIRLANLLKFKQLYGYYHPLLNSLVNCLRSENIIKTKIGALGAVATLLIHSKPFLAQAQHSEGTNFMAFSESLSEMITSLHTCLGGCLSAAPPASVLSPLLHTTATLISVSPYHRLRPSILLNIFLCLQPYLRNKDPVICECVLKCLNEIVCIEPTTAEQKDILKGTSQVKVYTTSYWISSELFFFLQNPQCTEKVRMVSWQVLGSLCKYHFHIVQENIDLLDNIFFSNINSVSSEEQLYLVIALNKFLEQIVGKTELDSYSKDFWFKLLEKPLILLLQSPEQIACEACDCLANMGPIVFSNLKEKEKILVITLIFGCINHEKAKVRAAAVHTLGIFLLFPHLTQEQFLLDSKDHLEKSLHDTNVLVRTKAAWALGNLVDSLVNNESNELKQEFNAKKILSTCLTLVKDDEMVKSNILRSVGYSLCLLTREDLNDIDGRELLEKAVQFFLKCSSSGTKMKMRWNACYAIGTMLRNQELYVYSENWMGGLITTLCNLIVSCSNFKVRASACAAMCNIQHRTYFGIQYSNVFMSLLDGLENAANMADFREYKHQDSLKQHLCIAICHLITLLEIEDVADIERIMHLRMDGVSQHFYYFLNNTPPEKSGIMITAANRIQLLVQSTSLQSQKVFLNEFRKILGIINLD